MPMYYSVNGRGAIGYTKDGGCFTVSEREIEIADSEQRNWRNSLPNFTPQYIAEMFPEALKDVERNIKLKQKEIDKLSTYRYEIERYIIGRVKDYSKQEFIKEILEEFYINIPIRKLEEEVAELDKILYVLKVRSGKVTVSDNVLDFEKAKQVPISNYVKFNRGGMALSIWVNEKTPSMKYYKDENRVWCFSSDQGGDVIDVVQRLYGLSKRDAVLFILGQ